MFFDRQQHEQLQRQQQLLARSELLRHQLADDAQVLQRPLALADQVRQGFRWLKTHPEVLAGGAVLLALIRPRRAWRLALRAWAGWQLWQRVQRVQQALMSQRLPPR